jgi:DNA repair protein RecN (Recombination protein N)
MIEELRIFDLGVIREATLDLHPGLTVVTGVTGAGKTMIITGLGLLLGTRADPGAVRTGAERARVEGRFVLSDDELAQRVLDAGGQLDDDELLVARHVTSAGRSRAYVGGAQVPAGVCADLAESLLTLHGQSEQVKLASPDRQRQLLDSYAGAELGSVLDRYRRLYEERRAAGARLASLQAQEQSRARELDLLHFGLREIEKVDPQPQEDVNLAAEAARLEAVDDLRTAAATAMAALSGDDSDIPGAVGLLAVARKAMDQPARHDPAAADIGQRLADTSYAVADLAADVARYLDDLTADPGRLEWIAARRSELASLTRKYGSTLSEVLTWGADAAARLVELESSDQTITELADQLVRLDNELGVLAAELSRLRTGAAAGFAAAVMGELGALAMQHARLEFHVSPVEPGPFGHDHVELLFSANPGGELRSLAKVASGGELSRVRLALEVVLASGRRSGTFVFDEIDAGVGGKVAVEIGRRLATLAQHAQVVVVTHLAQVAAFADRHFVVVKSDDGEVTTSGVARVGQPQQAAELARMMAGSEATESALAHARELVGVAAEARCRRG